MIEKNGPSALNLSLEFDEEAMLKDNIVYLCNTLDVGIDRIH